MNSSAKKMVPAQLIAAFLLLTSGCSDRESSPAPTSSTPLVVAPPALEDEPSVTITLQAGGMTSKYTPHYKDGRLLRITERRTIAEGSIAEGEYAFHGARLVRYRGAPLDGEGVLSIELDLNGAVLSASKNDAPASEADVRAIRNRASLLRNHALTQHATSTHSIQ